MESLIKQTRSKFANKEEKNSKIPPQKTQERKGSQSWLKRQFSRQMSWDRDFSVADYPTAVAAAAYAIQSFEESETKNRKERTFNTIKGETDDSRNGESSITQKSNKIKTKTDDSLNQPEPLRSALKLSDETSRKSLKNPDMKVPISTSGSMKMPQKRPATKKLSFAGDEENIGTPSMDAQSRDKHLNITEEKKLEPKVYRPPTPLPIPQLQPVRTKIQSATPPESATADAWEKEELATIIERYEKLRATIEEWETKKKRKAKRKIEKTEVDLDRKRTRDMNNFRSEIKRIEGIAEGAKVQAEENRKNEEYKAKQKANKIRLTGKMPATCFCF